MPSTETGFFAAKKAVGQSQRHRGVCGIIPYEIWPPNEIKHKYVGTARGAYIMTFHSFF